MHQGPLAPDAGEVLPAATQPPALRPIFRKVVAACIAGAEEAPDELGRVAAILAGPQLALLGVTLVEAVLGKKDAAEAARAVVSIAGFVAQRKGLRFLRSVRAARLWAPWWKLPRTVLAPDAVVVSHNSFVLAELRARHQAAGCDDGDQLLLRALDSGPNMPTADVTEATRQLATRVAATLAHRPEAEVALRAAFQPSAEKMIRDAAGHMVALQRLRPLPKHIVSGSGGGYSPRAIGLEVLRRGGDVERFDHGGPIGLVQLDEHVHMMELQPSTGFVVAGRRKADLVSSMQRRLARSTTEIRSGHGDPHFSAAPRHSARRRGARRRVVYATALLRGDAQRLQPLLPDRAYLAWQRRVLQALADPTLDVFLKPHPWDLKPGVAHPLSGDARILTQPVEQLLDDTDVFVFDYPQTTALWTAACTDRPIVFLDLGISEWEPEVSTRLRERFLHVPVRYSENGPMFDSGTLRTTVADAPTSVDSSWIRSVLAGD